MKLSLLSLLFFFTLMACRSSENLAGRYCSRFATAGFFGTTIRLKPDSSFEYVFEGDLIYDKAAGHYQVSGNRVFLNFEKEPRDSSKLYYLTDGMVSKEMNYRGHTFSYQRLLYIGHHKLFPGQVETDKKITSARGYSRHRKYLLFGPHYYRRRYYYRKMKN